MPGPLLGDNRKHRHLHNRELATIEILLETKVSTRSVQKGYKEDIWDKQVQFCTGLCEERT
jgi:hypothetical protein